MKSIACCLFVCLFSIVSVAQRRPSVKVASIINPPFLQRKNNSLELLIGNDRFEGYVKELLEAVSRIVGVDYEIILSQDGRYGNYDKRQKRWNGMMGMVQKKKVDLIAADLTMTEDRSQVVDFTTPFMSVPLTVMISLAPTVEEYYIAYLRPYSPDLWLAFFICFVVTSFALWIVARLAPAENTNSTREDVSTLLGSAWYLFSFPFKGSDYVPKALSTRILVSAWWIVAIIYFAIYLMLLNTMISVGDQKKVSSVEDLVKNKESQLGYFCCGSTAMFFKNSNNALHRQIFKKVSAFPSNLVSGNVEGLQKVKNGSGNFGYILEGPSADYLKVLDCSLYTVGRLFERGYALAFQKDHPFQDKFSRAILRLQSSGELDLMKDQWWRNNVEAQMCYGDKNSNGHFFTQMDNHDILFLFLGVMIVAAVILSLIELMISSCRNDGQGPIKEFFGGLKRACCCCFQRTSKTQQPIHIES